MESLENRATPTTINLAPVADNTLYQVPTADPAQQSSNGAGQNFYVGRTNQGNNDLRRGAIKFDLSAVPAGSTITSATLTLRMSRTISGAQNIALHRALMNWGEGTSNPPISEGGGAPATTNDVTWFYTFFSTQSWTTPGGDFVATSSASTSVSGLGSYPWTGAGLTADLQQWRNNPATNFGWILTGNETSGGTAKQFDTKEHPTPTARPVLTVEYTEPAPPVWAITKNHVGDFRQGDAARVYTVIARNTGSGPTTGTATVVDPLPAGLAPTDANQGIINGWTVSFIGQTVTAIRSDVLAPASSYPALTITVRVANDAPPSVTNTVTVSGGGAINPASASDPTTIIQVADLTIGKSHTGNFRQGDVGNIYTLTASNSGPGPTAGTVTVTDTLPAGLTPTVTDPRIINGWTVTTIGQTITATRGDGLASGGSYPALTLTVSVSATAPASVTNTAAVAGGGELNTGNNSASDPTTIIQVADLTIAKSHVGTFNPGDLADIYTITVSNVGAAPTDGSVVTVTDPLPTGLTPTAANSGTINGWTVSFSGQTVSARRSDVLARGTSYPALIITVSVANDIALVVTNTATVAGGGEVNTANNTASDPTATRPVADLILGKRHTGNFRQGDAAGMYVLTVNNIGPGPTAGTVTVTDTLPTGLAPTAANNGILSGWTVTTNGQTITGTRGDVLASGSSYPALTLTVSVSATAPPSVTNTATVAGGGEVNTNNNNASDPTTITQVADLTLTKSHTGNFRRGDSAATYTITVSNVGAVPTDRSTVTVTDTLPTGLTLTAANSGTINGWSVSFRGQTVSASRGDVLAKGSSYPALTLTVRVDNNAPASVTNTATVAGGGEINTANNTANDVTSITPVADLTIAISHSGSFTAGGTGTYTITASNIGEGASNAPVTILDMLPTGLTYAGPATVNGWTITVNGQTITATRRDVLASSGSFPALTLTVSVAGNAPASFINTATVSGGGEFNISNDAATDVTGAQGRRRRGADEPAGTRSTAAVLDDVANALTHSDEYFTNLVTQDYLQLLRRTPGAAEVNSWVGVLKGGLSAEQRLAGFTSSAEYYLRAGDTEQAWVEALYRDVLGRDTDAAGRAAWLQSLASGASRFNVAFRIAASVEHQALVVADAYQRYLGRGANAAEIAGWVNNLQNGTSNEQVAAAFVASGEFYARHGGSVPNWLNGAYQVVLERDPDPIGFNHWATYLQDQLAGN